MHFSWFVAWILSGKALDDLRSIMRWVDVSRPLTLLPLLFIVALLYGAYQHRTSRTA